MVLEDLAGYLGRGVDLTDVEVWEAPTKPSVLDVKEKIPFSVERIDEIGYKDMYADNHLEMKHKLAVEAGVDGSYEGFSASMESKYEYLKETTEKRHLLQISYLVTGHKLFVSPDELKSKLSEGFKKALRTKENPDQLFKEYGTHIAARIKVGGRAEYFCASSEKATMTKKDFELKAKAKYASAGGSLGGKASVTESSTVDVKDVSGGRSLTGYGGKSELLVPDKDGVTGWAAWVQSLADRPVFLAFDKNGLIPVWEFVADDKERQTELRNAYYRKAARALRTHVISVTSEVAAHPQAQVDAPKDYKLLSGGALDNCSGEGNFLTASFPEENKRTWRVSGKDHLYHDAAPITTYAIVAYDPDDIWEVELSSNQSGEANQPASEIAVKDGYTLIGGGARVHSSPHTGNLLTASYPHPNGKSWLCRAKDHLEADPGTITAYAMGLKCKIPGIVIQQ